MIKCHYTNYMRKELKVLVYFGAVLFCYLCYIQILNLLLLYLDGENHELYS